VGIKRNEAPCLNCEVDKLSFGIRGSIRASEYTGPRILLCINGAKKNCKRRVFRVSHT
jgi:hypothetical protein